MDPPCLWRKMVDRILEMRRVYLHGSGVCHFNQLWILESSSILHGSSRNHHEYLQPTSMDLDPGSWIHVPLQRRPNRWSYLHTAQAETTGGVLGPSTRNMGIRWHKVSACVRDGAVTSSGSNWRHPGSSTDMSGCGHRAIHQRPGHV